MKLYRYSLVVVGVTFVLLLVGGTVNPTGSSLACPDWPLCYGQVFPKMEGGVLFEHTHRLVATLVGLLTIGLAVAISRSRREEKTLVRLGWTAVALVVLQGVLGGLTVILKLPLVVSAGHLALSMGFFCFLIDLALRLKPDPIVGAEKVVPTMERRVALIAAGAVYVQIILGALVRHTESGRACGQDWLLCAGELWPAHGAGQLHMFHRLFGYLVFVVVIVASTLLIRTAKRHGRKVAKIVAMTMHPLILLQIVFGWLTVATGIGLHPVVAHLGGGALLLAGNWATYLLLGPRPDRVPA